MEDLKLITKTQLGVNPIPPQPGNPTEFFGEMSNDIQFSTVNDLEVISGLDKLRQDIQKILLTVKGQNTFFDLYGSDLQSMIGGKVTEYVRAKMSNETITALQVLEYINRENPNLDERPEVLESLEIQQVTIDQFEIRLSVITASQKSVSTGLTVNISQ